MSSLTRRLQIRALKRRGFVRTDYSIGRGLDGKPEIRRVNKGGLIVDPRGEIIGTRWPTLGRRSPALA